MAQKKTQLDKAIEAIDADIAVLAAARQRLVQQQQKQTTRKPRAVHQRPAAVAAGQ